MTPTMPIEEQQARLEEAFDRIEETILPCIAMMLETLLTRMGSDSVEELAETAYAAGHAGVVNIVAAFQQFRQGESMQ